ncbi:TPA: Dabb family protein [Salmonella enterica subsp. enterica serovar Potsdam]|nr:Dabb family protein [Salmonella enterica]
MIRHILLMKFNDDTLSEQLCKIKESFLSLTDKISGVVSVEWGENDSPEEKNAGFTHCVIMTFRDEPTRRGYLHHPEHIALKKIFRPHLKDIIVFDYQCSRRK